MYQPNTACRVRKCYSCRTGKLRVVPCALTDTNESANTRIQTSRVIIVKKITGKTVVRNSPPAKTGRSAPRIIKKRNSGKIWKILSKSDDDETSPGRTFSILWIPMVALRPGHRGKHLVQHRPTRYGSPPSLAVTTSLHFKVQHSTHIMMGPQSTPIYSIRRQRISLQTLSIIPIFPHLPTTLVPGGRRTIINRRVPIYGFYKYRCWSSKAYSSSISIALSDACLAFFGNIIALL